MIALLVALASLVAPAPGAASIVAAKPIAFTHEARTRSSIYTINIRARDYLGFAGNLTPAAASFTGTLEPPEAVVSGARVRSLGLHRVRHHHT